MAGLPSGVSVGKAGRQGACRRRSRYRALSGFGAACCTRVFSHSIWTVSGWQAEAQPPNSASRRPWAACDDGPGDVALAGHHVQVMQVAHHGQAFLPGATKGQRSAAVAAPRRCRWERGWSPPRLCRAVPGLERRRGVPTPAWRSTKVARARSRRRPHRSEPAGRPREDGNFCARCRIRPQCRRFRWHPLPTDRARFTWWATGVPSIAGGRTAQGSRWGRCHRRQ